MLGNRMKLLRKEHEWNQAELGKRIGVGRTTITEYECNRVMPPYDKLVLMADVFNVSIKYLTGESNSRTDEPADQDDIGEQLAKIIDLLHSSDYSAKINGQILNIETKDILAGQLESALRMAKYLNVK